MKSIFIICNPLVDYIIPADYDHIERWKLTPGSMNLVEYTLVEKILSEASVHVTSPGGSGANTARGIAWLAEASHTPLRVWYLGAIGADSAGETLRLLLEKAGVSPILREKRQSNTGVSLVLVTPDHERTMCTYLGACRELTVADLPEREIEQAEVLYITGYNWDTPNQQDLVQRAVEISRKNKGIVCLDLADPFVVHRYRKEFLAWIPSSVDILFGNREELQVLTDRKEDDEEVVRGAGVFAPTVIMKIGKGGCLIYSEGQIIRVPGEPVQAVDTTGAGDAFAAGYLFAYLLKKDPASCGFLANRLASRIVSVYGCDYSQADPTSVLEGITRV